ncbi:serine hydrolase [Microbacterium karelineae]|uniref:serine hydrolase n=1 Tax=Microbacterium karelineae TaxID=2654283 RepID=UPI0012EAEE57|nr:serine hydrolase [Microbacterium karelineae]
MATEPETRSASLRGERRSSTTRRAQRRSPARPRLAATERALDELARTGAEVSTHVADADTGQVLFSADSHVVMPVADLGVIPILIEVAARLEDGSLDGAQRVTRGDAVDGSGMWRHLEQADLALADVAALAAATGDRVAANALLAIIGLDGVTRRMAGLGMTRSAVLDRFRDDRGPDDAPHVAIGTTREYAELFAKLARREGLPDAVIDRLGSLPTRQHDVSLVGAPMAVDPVPAASARDLILVNQVGRSDGVLAEAGIVLGRRAALTFALFVVCDDASLVARHRMHGVFHTLGEDLLEIVA